MSDGTTTALTDELAGYIEREVALEPEPVAADTDLLLTGLVDSLGVLRIVDWLEDRLGVDIDPADVVLEHFRTVGDMVEYLRTVHGHDG